MTTKDTTAERRKRPSRASLFLSANITIDGLHAPVTVRVRNLSEGGMMIDGHVRLVPGMRVVVDLHGIGELEGQVAWTEAGRVGIAFAVKIDPKLARAPSPAGMATGWHAQKPPRIYDRRPGFRLR